MREQGARDVSGNRSGRAGFVMSDKLQFVDGSGMEM